MASSDVALRFPQQPIWDASIMALSEIAPLCLNLDMLYNELADRLPFNSQRTRQSYRSVILSRFFPEERLESVSFEVWRAYADVDLLAFIMRHQFMAFESMADLFLRDMWARLEPGDVLTDDVFAEFAQRLPESARSELQKRLPSVVDQLGYTVRQGRVRFALDLAQLSNPRSSQAKAAKTALLAIIHWEGSRQGMATISVGGILDQGIHCRLGFRLPEQARDVLREAAALDLVARYTSVDQLDQVTCRYSWPEFLQRRCRFQ